MFGEEIRVGSLAGEEPGEGSRLILMYICICMNMCRYVCMYVWMDGLMYVSMDGWTYVFIYVCMYVCMYLYVRK